MPRNPDASLKEEKCTIVKTSNPSLGIPSKTRPCQGFGGPEDSDDPDDGSGHGNNPKDDGRPAGIPETAL
jgi:hypothetical protein